MLLVRTGFGAGFLAGLTAALTDALTAGRGATFAAGRLATGFARAAGLVGRFAVACLAIDRTLDRFAPVLSFSLV